MVAEILANALLPFINLKRKSTKAIVSSKKSVKECLNLSIDAYAIDLDSSFTLDDFEFAKSDVFYFAPPTPTGDEDFRLSHFLQALKNAIPRRLVLISTTGVYGDSAGEWIDESTPVNPKADRALRRLSAEQALQTWCGKDRLRIYDFKSAGDLRD